MDIEILLIFLSIVFISLGIISIKNKRHGPEEGLRGLTFKGQFAVWAGIAYVALGVFCLIGIFLVK